MQPRLKESTQWTPLPVELQGHICEVFTERFSEEYGLEAYKFVTEGQIYSGEILLRVGLTNKDELRQYNFEMSVTYDKEKSKALDIIRESINTLEPSFEELFEEDFDGNEFPLVWMAVKGAKHNAHLRYSTVNTDLEKEADKLLEIYEKKLVYGEKLPEEDNSSDSLH